MKSGQWAIFATSTRSNSAYQLYQTLLSKLSSELSPEQIAQWPVMFRGEQGSLTAKESKMRYQEFLKNLKEVCRLLRYNEDILGTHSAADEHNLNVVDCDTSVTRLSSIPVLKWGLGGFGLWSVYFAVTLASTGPGPAGGYPQPPARRQT
jgi:hypothetical protein